MSNCQTALKTVLLLCFIITVTKPCLAQDSGSNATTAIVPEEAATSQAEESIVTTAAEGSSGSMLCDALVDALEKINSRVESEGHRCTILSACRGLVCDFGSYVLSMWVLPCANPPASRIAIYDVDSYAKLFDDVLMDTRELQGMDYSIQVRFEHMEKQFGIEVNDEIIGNLIPYTLFSTDPSLCFQTVCEAVTSSIVQSESTPDSTCSLTSLCDGAVCLRPTLGLTMTAKVLQCHDPPAVQLIIENPFDEKRRDLVNDIFTKSSNKTVLDSYEVNVIIHQLGGGIGLEISGGIINNSEEEENGLELPTLNPSNTEFPTGFPFPFPGFPGFTDHPEIPTGGFPGFPGFTDFPEIPTEDPDSYVNGALLDYTFFPIDQTSDECEDFSLMCLGMQGVVDKAARSNISCKTNRKCDGVDCLIDVFQNGALFPMSMIINPCQRPKPSVDLTLFNTENKILLEREVDDDDTIFLFMHDIKVTVDQLSDSDKPYPLIGFAIDLISPPEDGQTTVSEKNIIKYSEVPVVCNVVHSAAGSGPLSFYMSSLIVFAMIVTAVGLF